MKAIKAIEIPRREASKVFSIRVPMSEANLIEAKSKESGVKPAMLMRAIVVQMIKAGIEVN